MCRAPKSFHSCVSSRMPVLTLPPLLRRVFTLVLLTFGNDLFLLEHGDGWSDTSIEVFLVDFDPVSIPRLLSDLNAFENLLFVGLECGEILWGEYVGRAMETGQFHELADDFCGFQTTPQLDFVHF